MAYSSLQKRIGTDNSISSVKTKVYDVENKKLIAEFDSRREAADFAGVDVGVVGMTVRTKCRCYKNKLGITITFR